ncbi:MAG: hypothetical protein GWO02_15230 [Gammaproteobacteria bacterium]|nr:hypothetical protein [Gammaproteobacteria bacterium]
MYLSADPQCNSGGGGAELFEGYRVRAQVLPRGSAPPSDFNVENWPPAPTPGGGGAAPTPIGQNTTVALPCGQDSDVYVSYTLVGKGCTSANCFNTEVVFQTSTRVECGANLADPEERIQVKPNAQPRKKTTKR